MMIGFSLTAAFKLRLPIWNNKSSLINIDVYIRDKYDCITEYYILPLYVFEESKEIENWFKNFKDSKNDLTKTSFVNGLLIGNENDIGRILTSVSQQFNKINNDSLNNVVWSNGISIRTSTTVHQIYEFDGSNFCLLISRFETQRFSKAEYAIIKRQN